MSHERDENHRPLLPASLTLAGSRKLALQHVGDVGDGDRPPFEKGPPAHRVAGERRSRQPLEVVRAVVSEDILDEIAGESTRDEAAIVRTDALNGPSGRPAKLDCRQDDGVE